jgi:hypothetical protein
MLGIAACSGDAGDGGGGDVSTIKHKTNKPSKSGPSREEQTAGMVLAAAALRSADIADLKFDIDSRPQAGLPFNVELALLPTTESPAVTLELSGSDGLTLATEDATANFTDVTRTHVYRKSVVANAAAEGVYFLSVVATFKNADFTDSRSFTIPIIVEPAKPGVKGAGTSTAPAAAKAGGPVASPPAAKPVSGKPGSTQTK